MTKDKCFVCDDNKHELHKICSNKFEKDSNEGKLICDNCVGYGTKSKKEYFICKSCDRTLNWGDNYESYDRCHDCLS